MSAVETRLLELARLDGFSEQQAQQYQDEFARAYNHYRPYVQKVCKSIAGDELGVSEDLMQETMLKVHRHLDQFRGDCGFQTWLNRVAANVCLDHIRKNARRKELLEAAERWACSEAVTEMEQAAISKIDFDKLLILLAPGQRKKVLMYDIFGLNHREIAQAMGTTEDTARAHHRQAIQRAKDITNEEKHKDNHRHNRRTDRDRADAGSEGDCSGRSGCKPCVGHCTRGSGGHPGTAARS
jgi:RNA polymerase sigma-70 factor (ECF subfamily)